MSKTDRVKAFLPFFKVTNANSRYYQYQNGIYLPMALLGLGGILFLIACRYVVRDKQAVEK